MNSVKVANKMFSWSRLKIYSSWKSYGIKAELSRNKENLEIKSETGTEYFPVIWLRDNCTCKNCFDKNARSRIINWNDFKVDINIRHIKTINNDVEIIWDDDHHSTYQYEWLKYRSFNNGNQEKYLLNTYKPSKRLWDKEEFHQILECFDFNEVLTNDKVFYNWLMNLAVHGVVLIKDTPKTEKECEKLANRIAYGRRTHYGPEYHVKNKDNPNNVAYIARLLQLHTDLPFYKYKPGTILLHCIEQTKVTGGESLLTDGFYVAEKLRIENKEVFDILANTPVNWFDEGIDDQIEFNKVYRAPVICLNKTGKIISINHNIHRRDSYFTNDIKNVKSWYKSLKIFVEKIYENTAEFKLQAGEILAFDNTRLLHGRYSYEDTADNQRFLVGIYVDWDEIYSKIRVLKESLEK